MTSPAADFARQRRWLAELHAQAQRGPLGDDALAQLARVAQLVQRTVGELATAEAALAESRGLALEDTRALLAQARQVEIDTARRVVVELRRAGKVRSAARAYWALIRRSPRDAAWRDQLAGFGHLLEEYGLSSAGAVRAVVRSLPDAWWHDRVARNNVDEALAELRVDWAALPERA